MSGTYRILVTGSRTWDDILRITDALRGEALKAQDAGLRPVIVHGACPRGTDMIAARWARGYRNQVTQEPHPADWERFGRPAGFRRNAEMVALGADVCLAFIAPCSDHRCYRQDPHGSHGTVNCANSAEKAGIPVMRVYSDAALEDAASPTIASCPSPSPPAASAPSAPTR